MKKIDHVKKMVYIIVGILTIISLVFTIYKKISHAASSGSTVYSDFPLPVSSEYGGFSFTQEDYDLIFSALEGKSITPVFLYAHEVGGYWNLKAVFKYGVDADLSTYRITKNNNGTLNYGLNTAYVSYNGSTVTIGSGYDGASTVNYSNWFESSPSGSLILKENTFLYGYPLAINSDLDGELLFSDGSVAFEVPSSSPIISGHTKGGVLSNYIDSEDLLENSSDLPKVDTTPPADPSSNSGWFQKILNGIGRLNQSVQGGVLTIGDFIGSGIEKLEEKLSQVKDSITGLYDWFTEDFDKNQFQNGINSIPLISDLNGLKTLVENSGMFNWSDVSPAQSVTFTFDFGGAVLPHSTNTIDFSWYTGNVKTICNAILCTFLVLGLFVTVINQIPSIIGGHSGDKGGGSDS